jgi:predicted RNA-binding protein with PIN domain
MPYLIDGHNLIPHIGLKLEAENDEMELVKRLQVFCRQARKQVEVYFDGAPPGRPAIRKHGAVTAHFVRRDSSADAAMIGRLGCLGRAARNWTVVTSDREVQAQARRARAEVLTSDAFARLMSQGLLASPASEEQQPVLSDEETNEWLRLFAQRGKNTG